MRPIIGISSGDPAGIGLEVTLKAVPQFLSAARCILYTDHPHFERSFKLFASDNLPVRWIANASEATDESILFLTDCPDSSETKEPPTLLPWGEMSLRAGRRSIAYLEAASDAALRGSIQAIVTAPVSKASIGPHFKGQTEFLAEHAHTTQFAMSFFASTFKVVLATVHLSLRDALARISTEQYLKLIPFVNRELLRFAFQQPRIAVAAINPHAGEGGMFGREDMELLEPAVRQCAATGIRVSGPHSADSLYHRAHAGEFDVVIAPYHDQGLIPVKLIAHGDSTNVTLGLPYIRTSPDHGTAFEIAGRNAANAAGMTSAIRCAIDLIYRQSPQTP
ncbi:MAG TPA: 4-hydroxythreonine-4-phosphate dehydrogenase PdxA [Terriglobia bacterium]|nr:4-hydroxythreonine-4-phosphate dehydrogenase PdxA [Terriglobia bacterium]